MLLMQNLEMWISPKRVEETATYVVLLLSPNRWKEPEEEKLFRPSDGLSLGLTSVEL